MSSMALRLTTTRFLIPPTSRFLVPRFLVLGAGILVLAVLLPLRPAWADCVTVGSDVTCTGDDADGFDAGAADGLSVTVETDATVDNGDLDNVDAIRLNNDNDPVILEPGSSVSADGLQSGGLSVGSGNTVIQAGEIAVTGDMGNGIEGTTGNTIVNGGRITVLGDGDTGILVGNGSTVTNTITGIVEVTGTNVTGVQIGDGTIDETADLSNSGVIDTEGDGSVGIRAGANNEILNEGLVNVQGDGGTGILVGNGSRVINTSAGNVLVTGTNVTGVQIGDGTIDETDDLLNAGTIETDGDGSVGIRAGTDNDISNTGQVVVSGAGSTAVEIGAGSILTNQGSISASGDMSTAVHGSTGADTVTNFGFIGGSVDLDDGDDHLTLQTGSGGNTLLNGGAGTDDLVLSGAGSSTLNLDVVTSFESLLIDGGGSWALSGASSFVGGATLRDGTILLPGTAGITGNLTLEDDTFFSVQLDENGPDGRLDVVGTAIFQEDTTLSVFQAGGGPIQAQTATVLTATGGFTGTPFTNIPQDTTLLSFNLLQSANEISLEIARASYASVAVTPNQRSFGQYLDQVLMTPRGSDLDTALIQLDTLSAPGLRMAYDRLHPEDYDAHTGVMVSLGRNLADIAARPRHWCKAEFFELDPGPHQSSRCRSRRGRRADFRTPTHAWVAIFSSYDNRDAGSEFLTSDSSSRAILGGMDWTASEHLLLTGFLGITGSEVDLDDLGDGRLETLEAGLAAQAYLGRARARAAFGYGRGDHDHERRIRLGSISRMARTQYDSQRLTGFLELAYSADIGSFRIEPLAAIDIAHLAEDGFTETDAGDLSLEVDDRTNTVVTTAFGARVSYRHLQSAFAGESPWWTQGLWTPQLSALWRQTLMGADREIDARLVGASAQAGQFTVDAQDSEQGLDVGARITYQPYGANGSMSFGYDGFYGDAGTNHRLDARVELSF